MRARKVRYLTRSGCHEDLPQGAPASPDAASAGAPDHGRRVDVPPSRHGRATPSTAAGSSATPLRARKADLLRRGRSGDAKRRTVALLAAVGVAIGGGSVSALGRDPVPAVEPGALQAARPTGAPVDAGSWAAEAEVVLASVTKQIEVADEAERTFRHDDATAAPPPALRALRERRSVLADQQEMVRSRLATHYSAQQLAAEASAAKTELSTADQALAAATGSTESRSGHTEAVMKATMERDLRSRLYEAKVRGRDALTEEERRALAMPLPDARDLTTQLVVLAAAGDGPPAPAGTEILRPPLSAVPPDVEPDSPERDSTTTTSPPDPVDEDGRLIAPPPRGGGGGNAATDVVDRAGAGGPAPTSGEDRGARSGAVSTGVVGAVGGVVDAVVPTVPARESTEPDRAPRGSKDGGSKSSGSKSSGSTGGGAVGDTVDTVVPKVPARESAEPDRGKRRVEDTNRSERDRGKGQDEERNNAGTGQRPADRSGDDATEKEEMRRNVERIAREMGHAEPGRTEYGPIRVTDRGEARDDRGTARERDEPSDRRKAKEAPDAGNGESGSKYPAWVERARQDLHEDDG